MGNMCNMTRADKIRLEVEEIKDAKYKQELDDLVSKLRNLEESMRNSGSFSVLLHFNNYFVVKSSIYKSFVHKLMDDPLCTFKEPLLSEIRKLEADGFKVYVYCFGENYLVKNGIVQNDKTSLDTSYPMYLRVKA